MCFGDWKCRTDTRYQLWEHRFATEKASGAYHVQPNVERWKWRYYLAKAPVQLSDAGEIACARGAVESANESGQEREG